MVAKLKVKYLPKYYHPNLYRKMQNLRQRLLTVIEYTKEFYKVNIREGYTDKSSEKIAKYIIGLTHDIQDEIILLSPSIVEEDISVP